MIDIARLDKDLRAASKTMPRQQARWLVDTYYQMQDSRIRAAGQVRAAETEPHEMLHYLADSNRALEDNIKISLDLYTMNDPVGQWLRSIHGIGPVIAAGMLAFFDIERAPTAGHFWSYAGLCPDQKKKKGQKANWNPKVKTLCWKLGESFVKVSGNEKAFYGKVYAERKLLETTKNEAKEYADQAEAILASKNFGKETEAFAAYSVGKLPPAHIHSRAKRYAVKLFLAHYHHIAYVNAFGKEPPLPYPIAIQGHAHYIAPPQG